MGIHAVQPEEKTSLLRRAGFLAPLAALVRHFWRALRPRAPREKRREARPISSCPISRRSIFSVAGVDGHKLLLWGILFCIFGLVFGMTIYVRLKNLPVHRSMGEISELIYETCKTYLVTQGKFLFLLWDLHRRDHRALFRRAAALRSAARGHHSVLQRGGHCRAATGWRGSAFASTPLPTRARRLPVCAASPIPIYQIPLRAGMSIGMMLISVELLMMLLILLFVPGDYAGPCFIGFAIGESLGAAALRIAGGIFTKIADIGSDLMKIVFKIKEDDARNPGVIADCTGDNAGDSVGPSADGFETYGVTGVALITFILLGVKNPTVQVQLLVWIFVMRIAMLVASAVAYFINGAIAKARYQQCRPDELRSAAHLAGVDHLLRLHRA